MKDHKDENAYSPLHFKDAEMHPPLAHIYSLDEQVGEAE